MYFVDAGSVDLVFDHGKKTIPTGGFFGELALLLRSHRRTGSALALEPCRLTEFDRDAFEELLDTEPRLLIEVLRHGCIRLLESERSLVGDLRHQNRVLHETLGRLRNTEKELDDAEVAAHTDVLTGLFNRRFLEDQIEPILTRAEGAGDRPTLLLLDLDEFKQINDTHGHSVGDRVLREMSGRLKECLRQTDMPYRIGGDEFAVLLLGIEPELAVERAKQLLRALNGFELETDDAKFPVGVSIGGTHYRSGETWPEFFDRADRNLYLIKQQGRGGLAWEGRRVRTRRAED